MYFRPAILALLMVSVFGFVVGCQKSEPIARSAPPTVLSPDTTASVHWLGKKRLGITFGAYYFTRLWQLPQSAQLERQTLTKLATMPALWLPGGTNLTSDAPVRLWLLLNDLVQEESYLEIRAASNSQPSVVFAIRLNKVQTSQWLTNLPAVLEPLTGSQAITIRDGEGWSLKTTNALNLIQLAHLDEWTVVGVSRETNSLFDEITARIQRDHAPFFSSGTNLWLEADFDPFRLPSAFPVLDSQLPTPNHFHVTIAGDGANVLARGQLTFSRPLPGQLEPWHIPINLMHEPLIGFTAVRGIQPWLASWKTLRSLQIGAQPDQLYFWSLAGSPYQTYLAAPLPEASHQVAALSDTLLQKGNPWLAAHGYIKFDRASDSNGVTWGSLPDIKPFIKSVGTDADGWLFAGLLPETNAVVISPPTGMIQDLLSRTNLLYYDWEVTDPQVQSWLQLGQTARLIARQTQMPLDSVSLNCLATIMPRLGTSATIISRTAPDQLAFYRRSTLGFTALELHLLADWLESPRFPRGLHSQ